MKKSYTYSTLTLEKKNKLKINCKIGLKQIGVTDILATDLIIVWYEDTGDRTEEIVIRSVVDNKYYKVKIDYKDKSVKAEYKKCWKEGK
jgi:hypothetical protein